MHAGVVYIEPYTLEFWDQMATPFVQNATDVVVKVGRRVEETTALYACAVCLCQVLVSAICGSDLHPYR